MYGRSAVVKDALREAKKAKFDTKKLLDVNNISLHIFLPTFQIGEYGGATGEIGFVGELLHLITGKSGDGDWDIGKSLYVAVDGIIILAIKNFFLKYWFRRWTHRGIHTLHIKVSYYK